MFRRKLAILCYVALGVSFLADASVAAPPRGIDDPRVQSAGIRRLSGKHLVLYTDVPDSPEIERLPAVFDRAVPRWAEYFDVDEEKLAGWQARGFLIGDRRRFDALGLMPAANPDFINGISFGSEFWLYDQPTDYYRRHLMLHEGTHVFMSAFLGGCGPGWYMEGTAELLATHRLEDETGELTLGIMPRDRREVPMLGRIKLVRDAVATGRPLSFQDVLQTDNREQLGNEAYAWCWAAAKLLDSHPRYRDRFQELKKHVLDRRFNDVARRTFADDWANLQSEWQAFAATLDHGYDFERMAIDFTPGRRLAASETVELTIAPDRGWQSTGVAFDTGTSYRIIAKGRYQIAAEEVDGTVQPWPCEPGGVTIEYHGGWPLGMLLGAIDGRKDGATLADAFAVGNETTLSPTASGVLYLRVNDSPGRLKDNEGSIAVRIETMSDRRP